MTWSGTASLRGFSHHSCSTATVYLFPSPGNFDYPPPYLFWFKIADKVNLLTGTSFALLLRLPAVVADLGIAWVVQRRILARCGAWAAPGRSRPGGAGAGLLS